MTLFRESVYRRFDDVDWERWTPRERATLLFVLQNGYILLIHKKRGIGAGKVNGPGGRIDDGESPRAAAVREVREELRVTPVGIQEAGVLRFQFTDGHSILCHVFTASGCDGEPVETDEATPLWMRTDAIPFDHMWEDDRIWMPLLLAGQRFSGCALFHGERMVWHAIGPVDAVRGG